MDFNNIFVTFVFYIIFKTMKIIIIPFLYIFKRKYKKHILFLIEICNYFIQCEYKILILIIYNH
jgi:hypothetical protein